MNVYSNRRVFLKQLGVLSVSTVALPLAGCLPNIGGKAQFVQAPTVALGGPNNEFEFIKDRIRIERGDTVTWELVSSGHTATAYHPDNNNAFPSRIPAGAEPFNSPLLVNQGETFQWTFDQEGVYNYYCVPHEGLGMVGIIVVGNAVDGPGLVPPQDAISLAARNKLNELIQWALALPDA